jgi:hypothetical protein
MSSSLSLPDGSHCGYTIAASSGDMLTSSPPPIQTRRYLIQSKIPTQANLPGEKKPKKKQEKGKSRGKEHQ